MPFSPLVADEARAIVHQFEFGESLLHGMLGFLLFAGALHVDIGDLAYYKWPIALQATLGVLISVFVVAGLTWSLLAVLRYSPPSDRLPAIRRIHFSDGPDLGAGSF